MSFEITTDSSCNLPDNLINEFNLHIISLSYRISDKEYKSYEKGVKTDLQSFYKKMREKENITTSLITYESCINIFEPILQSGRDILHIGFSSALSGSYNVARMALNDLEIKYPGRTVLSVDSLAASLGEGMLVYNTALLRKEGKNIKECHDWLENNKLNLCHWFTVDDLFYLKRGGRISTATAIIGTLLHIKPVMHVDDNGKLIAVSKARGRKAALDSLVENMKKTSINPTEQTVFISHGDCIEDAEYVKNKVVEQLGVKNVIINYVDAVVGAHSGPGTVALFFFGSKR